MNLSGPKPPGVNVIIVFFGEIYNGLKISKLCSCNDDRQPTIAELVAGIAGDDFTTTGTIQLTTGLFSPSSLHSNAPIYSSMSYGSGPKPNVNLIYFFFPRSYSLNVV